MKKLPRKKKIHFNEAIHEISQYMWGKKKSTYTFFAQFLKLIKFSYQQGLLTITVTGFVGPNLFLGWRLVDPNWVTSTMP